MRRPKWLEDLRQDLWIAQRSLRRAPVLALTIVTTVGLGIGAATVIASAIDAALLRSLPYPDPGELVRIHIDSPPNRFRLSVADYLALESQQTQFDQVAAYTDRFMVFSDGVTAERLRARLASPTYFPLLGITPQGPGFTDADGRPGRTPTVILSHAFWSQRLGGRDAVGQLVRLDGRDHTIVGVLPRRVGPLEADVALFVAAQWPTPPRRGPFLLTVLGRLAYRADRSAAESELRAINQRIFPLWRSSYQDERATWGLIDLHAHVTGDVRAVASLALGATALVWLIACSNASNLLIARIAGRRRELAVRAALGAARGRVIRHLLAESALLAAGAAAIGLLGAWVGIDLLRSLGGDYFPRTSEIALDGNAGWFLLAITTASVMLFGVVPAVHGTRVRGEESLGPVSRSATASLAVQRVRRLLVATQFTIAAPLLVVAGLLLISLRQLEQVDLGFDSHNVLTGSVQLPAALYPEPGSIVSFWTELERRVGELPGVTAIGFADGRPPDDVGNFNNFDLEAFPTPAGRSQPIAPWLAVTPGYFRVLGLGLIEGRLLDDHDVGPTADDVIVVDRAWAGRYFQGDTAVGKRLREGGCTACAWTTVVGVVSEVKYAGLDRPDEGTVYSPMRPDTRGRNIVLRSDLQSDALVPPIRQLLRELDPNLPLSSVATVDELVARSLQRPRSLSLLVASLAIVALSLAVIGIYGVMSYFVQQHTREIGIRLAIGASRATVLRLIAGQCLAIVGAGTAVGLLIALAATRFMTSLLFGVGASDAVTFAVVPLVLLGVALISCLIPARRALAVQPADALRSE